MGGKLQRDLAHELLVVVTMSGSKYNCLLPDLGEQGVPNAKGKSGENKAPRTYCQRAQAFVSGKLKRGSPPVVVLQKYVFYQDKTVTRNTSKSK